MNTLIVQEKIYARLTLLTQIFVVRESIGKATAMQSEYWKAMSIGRPGADAPAR
jgi:hypothetical protein